MTYSTTRGLRVALITHYFPAHRGGVEIVAHHLVERLLKANHIISWFASNVDSAPPPASGLTLISVSAFNFTERYLGFPFPIWSPRVLPTLWRTIRDADIVHIHEFIYVGNTVAFVFAKLLRKPVVITQHIGFVPYKSRVLRAILSTVNHTLGAFMLRRANHVIFISRTVSDYFERFVRFRKRPSLVGNGVDHSVFRECTAVMRRHLRQEFAIAPEQSAFLFVGRFVEKKGLLVLRQLVEMLPQVLWFFAGAGPLNPSAWNLPNVRVFADRQSETLAALYQASDLLVLPSKGEGFPLVVQEAMSCGTPVMVSDEIAQAFPGLSERVLAVHPKHSNEELKTWLSLLQHARCKSRST